MIGSYRIVVRNSLIRYDFEIRRNITIIKGDSATGKTTLIEMIQDYYENGTSSGVELTCKKVCSVLSGRDWKTLLTSMNDRIIFIDEGNDFVLTDEFARTAQKSDNYYVIVTREGLVNLPYSAEEIYGIRESGKYGSLRQTYNELYHIYGEELYYGAVTPDKVIVEDSNSGFQFYDELSKNKDWTVVSANGKSNVFSESIKCGDDLKLLVIADGAAFGAEMDRMVKLIQSRKNLVLYLPESFEWIILKSGILAGDKKIDTILESPQNYVESSKYFSWERYFTTLLVEETKDSYLRYSKKKLNPVYLQKNIQAKICGTMVGIKLTE